MKDKQLFTTGEVIGLTRLKIASVQRYIKTFPDFFSDQARITSRGRRFTGEDVKRLLLIKYLYSIRSSKKEIVTTLRGEKPLPEIAWLEVSDALEIALKATKAVARSEEILKDMKYHSRVMKLLNNKLIHDFKLEVKRINELMAAQHKTLHQWIILYKKQELKRADDLRYVMEGRISDEQRKRSRRKDLEYLWSRTPEEIFAAEDEWERSQEEERRKKISKDIAEDVPAATKRTWMDKVLDIATRNLENRDRYS